MKEFEERVTGAIDQFKQYLTTCQIRVMSKKVQISEFMPPTSSRQFETPTDEIVVLPNYTIRIKADMFVRKFIPENNTCVENSLTGDDVAELLYSIFSTTAMDKERTRLVIHSFKDLLIDSGTQVFGRDINVKALKMGPYENPFSTFNYNPCNSGPLRGYHIVAKIVLHCSNVPGVNVNILHYLVDEFFATKGFPAVTEIREEK